MKMIKPSIKQTALGLAALGLLANPLAAQSKEADVSKPVKVFILLGQSNMVGAGKVGPADKPTTLEHFVKNEKQYPFLLDASGAWAARKDVRNVRMMSGKLLMNDWLTVEGNKTLGPEFGIGNKLGDAIEEPVMILKSCIGNRSLGWDLLPPGSERFVEDGKVYAGYGDKPDVWPADPAKGTATEAPPFVDKNGKPINWHAGLQYDSDVADAKKVLSDLGTYYPSAAKYEVAGFFFWQGEKDCGNPVHAAHYEKNLVNFIKSLRKDFNAPNAKFVLGTLGEATKESTGNTATVFQAHLAVDGESGKHPEFKGNVATVITNPMAQGGSGNGHYGGNAKVYMDVGLAMGEAMSKLLK